MDKEWLEMKLPGNLGLDHSLRCHTRSLEFYSVGKGQLLKDFKKEITAILER